MLQKCVARALTCVVRTLEPQQGSDRVAELEEVVWATMAQLLGPNRGAWINCQVNKLPCPAALSGLGCGSSLLSGKVSCLPCIAQCLPRARWQLSMLCGHLPEAERRNLVDLQYARKAEEKLREEGVEINVAGGVPERAEPRLDLADNFRAVKASWRPSREHLW